MSSTSSVSTDSSGMGGQGFLNVGTLSKKRVEAKRKRKGYGELKKRQKSFYHQLFYTSSSMLTAHTLIAPLERARVI
jgi:hypothetical protein